MSDSEDILEHPEHKSQLALYKRIIDDLKQINGSVKDVNKELSKVKNTNESIALVNQLWENYKKSAQFHLSETRPDDSATEN
ncbi:hypothetical protein HII12_002306 [Brettanomyces bruxellensis]|uniref:DASH complex subunit DAD4 n=1 Tax=Dekkera bruxellensis TaxID=5007 RepID=A0A7D9CZP6_DEKBR|nr:hypothetical protein HII12_002306 [Brettanomyces bruxellensis]VUG19757.1 DAD4 [Brettanomyces bruxellensis]